MHSRPVKRIGDVAFMRDGQFAEDAGPLAHPIRPDRYIEINNFYTGTVYQKGAEVIRMLHTLIGEEASGRACELYFERHDGQAVTCEDFVRGDGRRLGPRSRPVHALVRPGRHARAQGAARLRPGAAGAARWRSARARRATPGQPEKLPLHIPIRMGLVGPRRRGAAAAARGRERAQGHRPRARADRGDAALHLPRRSTAEPVPSLLRGFSAPVKLDAGYDDDELALLMAHDSDAFTRWDAGQRLAGDVLLRAGATTRRPAAGGRARPAPGRGLRRQPRSRGRGSGVRRPGAVAAEQRLSRPADGR